MLAVLADASAPRRADSGALRVAASLRSPLAGVTVSRPYADAVREAAGVLMRAGHLVRRADPSYPASLSVTALTHWTAGTSVDARDLDRRRLARRTRVHAALGRPFVRKVTTGAARDALRGRLEPFFAEYDV
ncbi:amidase, partial [Streptomyces sp. SID5789]|nr:amidase [Streptomyces sp. SID5789]